MKSIKDIYIYDLDETDFSHNGFPIPDFWEEPEVARKINDRYAFTGKYLIDGQLAEMIKKGAKVRAYCPDRTWQLFRIVSLDEDLDFIEFAARHNCYDANRNFIEDFFVESGSGTAIMSGLHKALAFTQKFQYLSNVATNHQFTAKEGHPVDIMIGSNNGGENLVGVTGGELDMYDSTLYLRDRLGNDKGFRVDFGVNLDAIKETVDDKEPPNTLYLKGKIPEGDFDENKEPVKVRYLEAPGMVITDENRVIGEFTNEECKTEAQLKQWADEILFGKQKVHVQKTMHQISIVDLAGTIEYEDLLAFVELQIGDTVHGKLQKNGKEVEERVIEYVWYPRVGEYKSLGMGSDIGFYTANTTNDIKSTIRELQRTENILFEKLLNATLLITGNETGHVMLYPIKRPREIRIMDTEDANTAKDVWRWNLAGLAHSSNGVNGPFNVAIQADGQIVADVITAGRFNAEMLRVGFNDIGDTLQLVNNALQIYNAKTKIMELTKQGLQFWYGTEEVGLIGTRGKNITSVAMEPEDYNGRALFITRTGNGKFIQLSAKENRGIQLMPDGKIFLVGETSITDGLLADKAHFGGDVNILGKLTINGQEVFPGQSGSTGGDWNGEYPPSVTSSADKFAWILWVILIGRGYSKASVAGILGNVQGEVGPTMNPDTAQGGGSGPGYGAVQLDGSRYPLIGEPTNNGREYVQRLIAAAGITEDYRTMEAQAKLIDWCMYNGQWLFAVQPATVDGFKALTDPATAAYVFLRNFERPAAAHPEREGWAVEWYNKFKDLPITSNSSILTVAKNWLGYFYYLQVHPSSDLGDLLNPNRTGGTDCSGFVWLVLNKAGYRVPGNMQWYTGSMTSDARGAKNWLTEIPAASAKAGDIIIVNLGAGVGNDGHTAILTEDWHGYETKIIEMGGMNSGGVGYGQVNLSFGYLLNGGDVCFARPIKR